MKEKQDIKILRYLFLGLIIFQFFYLFPSPSEKEWIDIALIWTVFLLFIILYKYSAHRMVYSNFKRVIKEYEGTIKKGSFFLSVPHSVEFKFLGKICRIGRIVDHKFDYMLEYSCPINKELEIVFIHNKKNEIKAKDNPAFSDKFIVAGQNKELIKQLLENAEITKTLESLMTEFKYLIVGKDGYARLDQSYNIRSTDPEKIFSVFKDLVKITDFFERTPNREI